MLNSREQSEVAQPGILLLLKGAPWAVSALPIHDVSEGHCSGDHLLLARSPVLDAEYWRCASAACSLPFSQWFAACQGPIPVRIHSECVLGDVFGSDLCDCGDHLEAAIQYITTRSFGVIIYLRQEGRGIGLAHKLETLRINTHVDTFERNEAAGYPADARHYRTAVRALGQLGIGEVMLLSDSPRKRDALEGSGIRVSDQVCLPRRLTVDNARELLAKQRRGYRLSWTSDDLLAVAVGDAPQLPSVVIDWTRVRQMADRLSKQLSIQGAVTRHVDKWPQHPPTGHPRALEFYMLTILHQFAFWQPSSDGWMIAWYGNHHGQRLRGSDFIWSRMRWLLDHQPDAFRLDPPALECLEASALLDDDGLPAPHFELHLDLSRRLRRYLAVHPLSETVEAVRSGGSAEIFVERFRAIPGYGDDPYRKKLHLLFMYLTARSDSPLGLSDRSLNAPAVDYHIQRLLLRAGMIVVQNGALHTQLTERRLGRFEDEDQIRATAYEVVRYLIAESGAPSFSVDQLLFNARTYCGEDLGRLDCNACWLNQECRRDVAMFQPLSIGRAWY